MKYSQVQPNTLCSKLSSIYPKLSFTMQHAFNDVVNIGPLCSERFIDSSNVPEISQYDIELAGCSNLSGDYIVGRVTPPNHTLFYSINGTGRFRTYAGEFSLSQGQLVLLPAKQSFEVAIACEQWDIIWLNLADTIRWKALLKESAQVVNHAALEGLHYAMELLYIEKRSENRQSAMHIVMHYLEQIVKAQTSDNSNTVKAKARQDSRLITLFSDVNKQLQFDWNMQTLSERAHYSAAHLHRLCLSVFGRSPMQQVIHLRMLRARNLLTSTQWPVSYIANYVGYKSVFTFSKRFKKSVGVSPSQYRITKTD